MRTIIATFFLVLLHLCASGQDGPGDVGPADGSGRLIMWLDASKIDITNTNNITDWHDLSGYGSDLSQSNVNAKPNLQEGVINDKAAVQFDGGDEELEGTHTLTSAPATIFCVFKFDNPSQSSDDNDYVYSVGKTGGSPNQLSLTRRRSNDTGNANKYYSWDGGQTRFGSTLSDQAYISRQVFNNSSPFHDLYLNGAPASPADYGGALTSVSSQIKLGEWTDFSPTFNNQLDGYIAEFIMFNSLLLEAEVNILENYLSEKYAISIMDDLYTGNLEMDVTGVGTESDGSKTQASSAGLTITQASGFEDSDYILVGHETSTNSVNTSDIGDMSGTIVARWDRYWYFEVSNSLTNTVIDITFDHSEGDFFNTIEGTASDYVLLRRATESGFWTKVVDGASSVIGDQVIFENVEITANDYYTLGTVFGGAQAFGLEKAAFSTGTGPGGVGQSDGTSSLQLWFDASAMNAVQGDLMVTWEDLSGYGHNAFQSTFSKIPTFNANVTDINNRQAILFDESPANTAGDFYDGNLSSPITSSTTLISVGYFGSVNQDDDDNDYFIGVGSGTNANEVLSISRRRADEQPTPGGADHPDEYYSWYGTEAPRYGPTITGQNWNIYYQTIDNSTNEHTIVIDGVSQSATSYTGTISTNTDFSIGKWPTNENNFLEGEIAEIVFYDRKLNSAEDTILHNYLSAKYDLSIPTSKDIYAGDDPSNGNYDENVAGIGTEADGSNSSAVSAGILATIASPFSDGEYLMFGHNTVVNSANGSDARLPSHIKERSDRDWYFDLTTLTSLEVDLLFDLSQLEVALPASEASNYVLIYRPNFSTDWSVNAVASSYSTDQVLFDNVVITDNGYYTIGTLNNNDSPLPVELVALEAYQNESTVIIEWMTSTEVDNQEFQVFHSADGSKYGIIQSVKGHGTTVQMQNYRATHLNPNGGVNYYQLHQIDYDGARERSEVVSVMFEHKSELSDISLYPNPADQKVYITSVPIDSDRPVLMTLNDLQGQTLMKTPLNSRVLDVSSLQNGLYILRLSDLKSKRVFSTKRIIINHN